MSVSAAVRRITPPDISAAKGGQPLVCLTAYTTPVARLADALEAFGFDTRTTRLAGPP